MTGSRWSARALSRWSTYAVFVHLILAQSDSETRGESADDSALYGCTNLTCKKAPGHKAGEEFPYCPRHGEMTRKVTVDPDGTKRS